MAEETTAAHTLDLIREGGVALVSIALARLEEAERNLLAGHFDVALTRIQEAQGYVSGLSTAQQVIGTYGKNIMMIRAREVKEGMHLPHIGTIERVDVEVEDCPTASTPTDRVTLHVEGDADPIQFEGDKQLVAWTG